MLLLTAGFSVRGHSTSGKHHCRRESWRSRECWRLLDVVDDVVDLRRVWSGVFGVVEGRLGHVFLR